MSADDVRPPPCPECGSNEVAGLWWSETEWLCFQCNIEFEAALIDGDGGGNG